MNSSKLGDMWRYLKGLPTIAAFVVVDGSKGTVEVLNSSGAPLLNWDMSPTPEWAPFSLEDYDAMIENISAIDDLLTTKKDLHFRFDLKVFRGRKFV